MPVDPAAAGGHFVAKVVLVELGENGEKFHQARCYGLYEYPIT